MLREGENIEYKESLAEIDEGGETLVGFANKSGGTLYFGVKNNGAVVGVQSPSEKTIRGVSHKYLDNIEPKLFPHISIETMGGKGSH